MYWHTFKSDTFYFENDVLYILFRIILYCIVSIMKRQATKVTNTKTKKYIKRPNKRRAKKEDFETKIQLQSNNYKVKHTSITEDEFLKRKRIKQIKAHKPILICEFQANTLIQLLHTFPNLHCKFRCKKDANGNITFDTFKRFWEKHVSLSPESVPCYKDKVYYDPIHMPKNEIEIIQSNYGCRCYDITRKRYKMVLYLDRRAHGHTNQYWGSSNTPTILQYAQSHKLPIVDMLLKLQPFYTNTQNTSSNKKIECNLFIF